MKRVSTKSVSVVSGNKVFIGIDVHKDSWHITARTDGEEVFNGRIPASYHSFLRLLERFKDCEALRLITDAFQLSFLGEIFHLGPILLDTFRTKTMSEFCIGVLADVDL